jgi:metallo-beta-lactamase class B
VVDINYLCSPQFYQMPDISLKNTLLATALSISTLMAHAQKVYEPDLNKPEWSAAYQPFRIAGNLYYVGTYDLASYLITTSRGNILINTGLAASAPMIKANIEALGFKFADTKILLTNQAHFDHMGAMAAIKKMTGAKMMIDAGDSAVVTDGGTSDYALGSDSMFFHPVKIDRLLHDKDVIKLGDMQITMLHHPGHTEGSCSFLFDVKDEKRSYKVLIANMPTIVTEQSFSDIPAYPEIAKDYAYTLDAMKNLKFDLWVAAHASQFDLHKKHKPGDAYNPAAFMDRKGYDEELEDLQKQYNRRMTMAGK